MGNKVVYFKGVRLWENAKHWKPTLVRTGGTRKSGLSRRLGKLNPRSPNFYYEVAVHTDVKPAVIGAGDLADLGYQETFNLQMLQVQKDLVEQSNSLGDLAWCQDEDEFVTIDSGVVNPGTFPGAGSAHFTGAGWVPATDEYALFRDPDSGEGFVSLLTGVAAGVASATFQQAVAVDWQIIRIRYFFPDTAFIAMGGWETEVQAEDRHAFDVTYAFESGAHPTYKAGYTMDLS